MAIGRPITETPNIADKIISIIATAGQTEFTVTGGYRVNHLAVFRNGVRLVTGRDYIAGDGLTVELIEDASLNDVLEFQVFDTFSISDAIVGNSTSQTLTGDLTVNGTLTVGANGIGTMVLNKMNVGIISSTTGITTIQSEVAAASTSTGALQIMGGVGIGKSLFVGGNLSVGGTVTYEDITNVDSVGLVTAGKGLRATTGGLVVTAGITTLAGLTTVTNTAALHCKQLNVSAGSTFGGAITASDSLTVDNLKLDGNIITTLNAANLVLTANSGGIVNVSDTFDCDGAATFDTSVAINTTGSIDAKVEVYNAASKINALTLRTGAHASGYVGLAFASNDTHAREKAAIYFQETNGGAHYTGDIVFAANSTSGSATQVSTSDERLRITAGGKYYFSGTGAGSASRGLEIDTESVGAADEGVILNARASGSTGRIKFQTNSTTAMTIMGGGDRIGIGTDAPYANGILHCDGNIVITSSGNAPKIIFDEYSSGTDPKAQIAMDQTDSTNASLHFYTEGSGTLTERLKIDSSGRLTVGDEVSSNRTSYRTQLSASDANVLSLQNPSSTDGADINLGFYARNTNNAAVQYAAIIAQAEETQANSTQKGHLRFGVNIAGTVTERMRISSNGMVNVGTETNQTAYTFAVTNSDWQCMRIENTNADASGAYIDLVKHSASPAADDECGVIRFRGDDSAGTETTYCHIKGITEDPTNSGENGRLIFQVSENGTAKDRLQITSSGDVIIGSPAGTSGRETQFSVDGAYQNIGGVWTQAAIYSTDSQAADKGGTLGFGGQDGSNAKQQFAGIKGAKENSTSGNYQGYMSFWTRPDGAVTLERLRITSTGALQFSTGSRASNTNSICASNGHSIDLNGSEYLYFRTNNSEVARFNTSGSLMIGTTSDGTGANLDSGGFINSYGRCVMRRDDTMYIAKSLATGGYTAFEIRSAQTTVGSITFNSGGSSFNTTSDSRLKENVVDIDDGITRLKALKPKRFNYKSLPDVTQDGFIAHEAQEVLPYAVTGTKDEVATEDKPEDEIKVGDPIYQEVDYSKLTPLLTAALQEAIGKIEILEEKVAALEST